MSNGELAALRAAYRVLAAEGHDDLYFGHVSVIDRDGGVMWLKRSDMSFARVGEHDFVAVDLNGERVAGDGPVHSEVWLHLGIYAQREDVVSVAHSHARDIVAYSATAPAWPVIDQYTLEMSEGLTWHDSSRLIISPELGRDVARSLGGGRTCILRCHGGVVADSSIQAATVGTVELGRAIAMLRTARGLGDLRTMPEAEEGPMRERFIARRQRRVQNMWRQLSLAHLGRDVAT